MASEAGQGFVIRDFIVAETSPAPATCRANLLVLNEW